ncbi:MAG: bifunctional diaminohydroxyphosphoribosylaminopyrimidine deaminase/5-amino-6-(5-phosphoribosylamino)uracil reductase RibD [Parafilimonas sp.]
MTINNHYMHRCLELAKLGAGNVAPNPMVGAVLVHNEKIIGEGYHEKFGEAHAEVNCINSVYEENKSVISSSTLYVLLEPCVHYGNTPPCADLIIESKIPHVVIGCRDPFPLVDGKGIEKLQQAGIYVEVGILEDECIQLNQRFITFYTKQRPYSILKWAQSANGKINTTGTERLLISNDFTNRLVHKWRSEEAAILVGTNTALLDNPELTNRLWNGKGPIRLVIDKDLRLPLSLNLFNGEQTTIIFHCAKHNGESDIDDFINHRVIYYKASPEKNMIQQIMYACYQLNIQSILVEGGATLLQSFIDEGLWDEARVITNNSLHVAEGLSAPELKNYKQVMSENIFNDSIDYFIRE